MSRTRLRVKIHDVLHDPLDDDSPSWGEIKPRVEKGVRHPAIEDIDIRPGSQNSPIFIDLEAGRITPGVITRVAEQVVTQFADHVDGVDVDKTLRNDNLRLLSPD